MAAASVAAAASAAVAVAVRGRRKDLDETGEKELKMSSRTTALQNSVRAAVGAGAVAAALLGTSATAAANPPPPHCTAADLAGISSGVAASTSVYLFTHPEVNAFFTSLKGQPREQIREHIRQYADANPHVRDELQRIRQPMVDFRNRCG